MTDMHPIQIPRRSGGSGKVSSVVTLKAYEVYSHVHSPQPALITGWCRGGFGAGELIAYLYAASFPKAEWSARVDEALRGMEIDGQ